MNVVTFNKLFGAPENKSLIRKAFTSATGVGEALIPEHLEEVITNTLVRLVPEIAVPILKFDHQKFHEFVRLTGLPSAGSAMGENSVTPIRNSTTERASVELKVLKRKGSVTGFVQDASANFMDAQAFEMETHLQAFGYDMRTYMLYGNRHADAYTFDGLEKFISSYRLNGAVGGTVITLAMLDAVIDSNMRKQGSAHRRVFIMSPEMLSKLSQLYTQVRDNRDAIRGTNVIEIDGGWRLQTYRDIPIIESTSTRPTISMGTVTAGHAGSGGAITDDTWYFRVSAITWDGESLASAEINNATSSSDTLTLSFTPVTNALYYKVYVGTVTGELTLRTIVSAFTYDGDGTITGSTSSIVFSSDPTDSTDSVPTHMQSDVPLTGTLNIPMELIFFWDLDEYQGMGKLAYTNSAGSRYNGLATVEPLAKTDDNMPFLVKSYPALIDSFEATSGLLRGYKVA